MVFWDFSLDFFSFEQFRLTVMVVTCILATLVDLIGTLHFWDVTIDVIVCVNIVLVGACIYNL